MACLRSFSRRNLYSKYLCCKTSRPLFSYIKDDTKANSSLIRSFHNQSLFQERKQVSFAQGLVSYRHMSSQQFPVTMVTTELSDMQVVQYVVNGVHELTGTNWWMSIVLTAFLVNGLMLPITMRADRTLDDINTQISLKGLIQGLIQNCDPEDVAKYKKIEEKLSISFDKNLWSCMYLFSQDVCIYISFIKGINTMAKTIPGFEIGGIFSSPESFYILPLLTGYTFWLASEIFDSEKNLVSRMKELFWFVITFTALQVAFNLEPAVYFYIIPSRICTLTMVLMMKNNQTKFLG